MALIKCPACGHGVLSVASQCPKCSAVMAKTPLDLGGSGELAECRGCGRPVLSRAHQCANCGVRHPGKSYAGGIAMAVIGGVGLVGWLTLALLRSPSHRAAPSVSLVARANASPADSKMANPSTTPNRAAELKAPARLIFIAPPDRKPSVHAAVARPPRDSVRPESVRVAEHPAPATTDTGEATQPRLVAAWANVRKEPNTDAAVVQVLRPGQAINVVQRRGGWWAVYAEGRRLGFVSRTLLGEQAPAVSETQASNQ